jgi:hypothetical protein
MPGPKIKIKYKTEIGVKHARMNFCSHHIQSKIYSCLQFLTVTIISLKFANDAAMLL